MDIEVRVPFSKFELGDAPHAFPYSQKSADFSSDSLELAAFNSDSLEQAALSCDSLDWNSSLLTRQYIDIWSWRGVIWQLPRTMQQQNILQSHLTKIY